MNPGQVGNRFQSDDEQEYRTRGVGHIRSRRKLLGITFGIVTLSAALLASAFWLGGRASVIRDNLMSIDNSLASLENIVREGRNEFSEAQVDELLTASTSAKAAATDPVWKMASSLPWVGANFAAVTETTLSVDDIVTRAVVPVLQDPRSLDLESVAPVNGAIDVQRIEQNSPQLTSVARVVRLSKEKLVAIDLSTLVPEIAGPLGAYTEKLTKVSASLDRAADSADLLPEMLGAKKARNYLLMIQNNAESRASGGIPGALAVLRVDQGRFTFGEQISASGLSIADPAVPVDPQQETIYSTRLGKYIQDVNLTPDFPTAASTAQALWERQTGIKVDGVISIDPVALSFVLGATGPVQLSNPYLVEVANAGLPTKLSAENVIQTLLSDVYEKIDQPELQDSYFAGVAQEVFSALTSSQGDAEKLVAAITRGVEERRVLVWSSSTDEQSILAKYVVSGSAAGSSVSPAQFGVYFNDGTGAKMDYYVKRTVQLIKECPKDGYEGTTVRVTSTNSAPADAATSLPPYVTGDGVFGVPPGSVQTNIVAYGPAQAHVETAKLDGQKTEFAPYFHGNRPVGVLAIQLAPGESRTVDFTFGKIVQHTEPNVVVTPTVQDVKKVTLPTERIVCG